MADAIDELDYHFAELKRVLTNIDAYQAITKQTSKMVISEKRKQLNLTKASEQVQSEFVTNLIIRNYISGKQVVWTPFKANADSMISNYLYHQNKQYQWLLVEAYECFENYLKHAYTLLKVTKKWKNLPQDIIKEIHDQIPLVERIVKIRSENNADFLDSEYMKFMLIFISKMRHLITHNHGLTKDKEKFIKECIDTLGINGRRRAKYEDEINFHFGTNEYENLITLIEIQIPKKEPTSYTRYIDRLGDLIEIIASYAQLIHPYVRLRLRENLKQANTDS